MSKTPTIKTMGRYLKLTEEQEKLRQLYQSRLTDDVEADETVYLLLTNSTKLDMIVKMIRDVFTWIPSGDPIIPEEELKNIIKKLVDWRDLYWACMAPDEDIVVEELEEVDENDN